MKTKEKIRAYEKLGLVMVIFAIVVTVGMELKPSPTLIIDIVGFGVITFLFGYGLIIYIFPYILINKKERDKHARN